PTSDYPTLPLHDALPIYISISTTLWIMKPITTITRVDRETIMSLGLVITPSVRISFITELFCETVARLLSMLNLDINKSTTNDIDRKSTRLNSSHVKTSY